MSNLGLLFLILALYGLSNSSKSKTFNRRFINRERSSNLQSDSENVFNKAQNSSSSFSIDEKINFTDCTPVESQYDILLINDILESDKYQKDATTCICEEKQASFKALAELIKSIDNKQDICQLPTLELIYSYKNASNNYSEQMTDLIFRQFITFLSKRCLRSIHDGSCQIKEAFDSYSNGHLNEYEISLRESIATGAPIELYFSVLSLIDKNKTLIRPNLYLNNSKYLFEEYKHNCKIHEEKVKTPISVYRKLISEGLENKIGLSTAFLKESISYNIICQRYNSRVLEYSEDGTQTIQFNSSAIGRNAMIQVGNVLSRSNIGGMRKEITEIDLFENMSDFMALTRTIGQDLCKVENLKAILSILSSINLQKKTVDEECEELRQIDYYKYQECIKGFSRRLGTERCDQFKNYDSFKYQECIDEFHVNKKSKFFKFSDAGDRCVDEVIDTVDKVKIWFNSKRVRQIDNELFEALDRLTTHSMEKLFSPIESNSTDQVLNKMLELVNATNSTSLDFIAKNIKNTSNQQATITFGSQSNYRKAVASCKSIDELKAKLESIAYIMQLTKGNQKENKFNEKLRLPKDLRRNLVVLTGFCSAYNLKLASK